MKTEEMINGSFDFDPIKIHVIYWMPEETPKKVLHICHGMAEHAQRYEAFALHLNSLGIGVVAHDHRQHGLSMRDGSIIGVFNEEDSWQRVLADVEIIQQRLRNDYSCPMVILGHSMGSVIARSYLQWTKLKFESAVFSGVPNKTNLLWRLGIPIAKVFGVFNKDSQSKFLDKVSTGGFNKPYKPGKTGFEWLSTNEASNQMYYEDPMCGYPYNPKLYEEISRGFLSAYDKGNIAKMPKIPMLFASGAEDPVGKDRESMEAVAEYYKNNGLETYVNQVIFTGMRHEILNEIGNEKVFKTFSDFICG